VRILLVEDDLVDIMTTKRAFHELNISNHIETVSNGEEALNYLRNPELKRPVIILLDLNMPRMNGIEFLKIAKDDNSLRQIPIVILTTSRHEADKLESFQLGAAGYFLKPIRYADFVDLIKTFDMYWSLNELPKEY